MFLGEYDDGRHYADGFRYHPSGGAIRTAWVAGDGVEQTASLERYGYAVYQVEHPAAPVQLMKPATPNAEWDWVRQYADCSTAVTVIDPLATAVTLPAEAGDTRGWLVVRQYGAPASYAMRFTAPVREVGAGQGDLRFLDAPTAPTVGREAPIVLRYDAADCRRVDVSARAGLTSIPEGAAVRRAGSALAFTQAGEVTVQAEYAGAVTAVTFTVAPDDTPEPPGYASGTGCRSAGASEAVLWLGLPFVWLSFRRLRSR